MHRSEEIPNFQDVSKAQKALTEGDQWKTFFFHSFGNKNKENCARCPQTVGLLHLIPGMKTGMFSILEEGKSMIFDDSNEHEVWNDSDCYRVVLFVDFVRATILPLSTVNRSIISVRSWSPRPQHTRGQGILRQCKCKESPASSEEGEYIHNPAVCAGRANERSSECRRNSCI
jgi:ornithine lipid ester-linked acyl 2-hydroxylase